jgi:hypothetical protein
LPYEYWVQNCHRPPKDLAAEFGKDPSNFRRGTIVPAREEYPDLPWYQRGDGAKTDEQVDRGQETHEILDNGSHRSTRLLQMDAEQAKDPDYLLTAHGFDAASWELLSARNNIWNVFSDEGGVQTLYSSRIVAKPTASKFDIRAGLAAVDGVKPRTLPRPLAKTGNGLLEAPLFDLHFGNATIEDYADALAGIIAVVESRTWKRILLPIGSDLFHADNFRNTTSNGTQMDTIDWPKAWADTATFFVTLIDASLRQADEVEIVFVKGNHCESMSWAFCQMLAAMYPQVRVDLDIEERKVHVFGQVAIGFTHGDKAVKDLDRVFLADFAEFRLAEIKEIHTGHIHHEKQKDWFGVMIRAISTANRSDQWHRDNGYIGANKRFMLFEYSENAVEAVRYV